MAKGESPAPLNNRNRHLGKETVTKNQRVLNRILEKFMIGWKPFSDRLLSARFHFRYARQTVIVYTHQQKTKRRKTRIPLMKNSRRQWRKHKSLMYSSYWVIFWQNWHKQLKERNEFIMGKHGCGVMNNNCTSVAD